LNDNEGSILGDIVFSPENFPDTASRRDGKPAIGFNTLGEILGRLLTCTKFEWGAKLKEVTVGT
jgi:hypothetical protein